MDPTGGFDPATPFRGEGRTPAREGPTPILCTSLEAVRQGIQHAILTRPKSAITLVSPPSPPGEREVRPRVLSVSTGLYAPVRHSTDRLYYDAVTYGLQAQELFIYNRGSFPGHMRLPFSSKGLDFREGAPTLWHPGFFKEGWLEARVALMESLRYAAGFGSGLQGLVLGLEILAQTILTDSDYRTTLEWVKRQSPSAGGRDYDIDLVGVENTERALCFGLRLQDAPSVDLWKLNITQMRIELFVRNECPRGGTLLW